MTQMRKRNKMRWNDLCGEAQVEEDPGKLRKLGEFLRWNLFELKHDGFRSLSYLEDGRCRLVSRHRNVYKSFETLRDALTDLKAKDAILDGFPLYAPRALPISA
jgi:ATP-dependent DNA ligase